MHPVKLEFARRNIMRAAIDRNLMSACHQSGREMLSKLCKAAVASRDTSRSENGYSHFLKTLPTQSGSRFPFSRLVSHQSLMAPPPSGYEGTHSRITAGNLFVNFKRPLCCVMPAELVSAFQALDAQPVTKFWIVNQVRQGRRYFRFVKWINHQTGIANYLRQAGLVTNDHRCAAFHCFQRGQAKTLKIRGVDKTN